MLMEKSFSMITNNSSYVET